MTARRRGAKRTERASDCACTASRRPKHAGDSKAARSAPTETLVATPDATRGFQAAMSSPGQAVTVRVTVPLAGRGRQAASRMEAGRRVDVCRPLGSDRKRKAGEAAASGMAGAVTQRAARERGGPTISGRASCFRRDAVRPARRAQRMPVRMAIQNNGPQIWKKDQVRIGYHWYYQDGSEAAVGGRDHAHRAGRCRPAKRSATCWSGSRPRPSTARTRLVWDVKVGRRVGVHA